MQHPNTVLLRCTGVTGAAEGIRERSVPCNRKKWFVTANLPAVSDAERVNAMLQ